jgi:hypothetical protein
MACENGDKFRLKTGPDNGTKEINVDTNVKKDICTVTRILDRLHKEFTEQYVAADASTGNHIKSIYKKHPTFYLRDQFKVSGFNNETTDGTKTNRFYTIFTTKTEADPEYRGAVSAIMKGEYDTSEKTYATIPESISSETNFSTNPNNFKGVYGLNHINELLEKKIAEVVNNLRGGDSSSDVLNDTKHYEKRQNIKTTLEEIAHRENQIYREKFLNIILIVIGIFLISMKLVESYTSFGVGGFGNVGGWLTNRFGSSSGGIFSRFGGLGLGSSGRSRVGNLFTNSPYELSKRE